MKNIAQVFRALFAVVFLTGLAGCGEQASIPARNPVPVTTAIVSNQNEVTALKYSGTIEPGVTVFMAFRTGGYVKEIARANETNGTQRLIQTGDQVASGAILAQVEDREYQSQVTRARSGVLEAQSGLLSVQSQINAARNTARQAEDEFLRAERLFAADSITRFEYDTARTRNKNAAEALAAAQAMARGIEAKIQSAEAMVGEIRSVTRDTAIRAPFDGYVLSRTIESGSLVGPGTVAFSIARLDPVKLRFSLPDRLLNKVSLGQSLEASLDFKPQTRFPGRVSKMAVAADPRTRLFDIELTIPNPEGELKPGMICQIELNHPAETDKGLIPLEAIVPLGSDTDSFAVFQMEESAGTLVARRREVKLGRPVGNRILVESGLLPGQKIILSGAAFLEDGDPIHVIEDSF